MRGAWDAGTEVSENEAMAIDEELQDLLLRHGRYAPVTWLHNKGWLSPGAHERWRRGELPSLELALRMPPDAIKRHLQQAAARAEALGLEPAAPSDSTRQWCSDPKLAVLLATDYVRPDKTGQLDLFADTAATQALNAVVKALAEQRGDDARRALAHLAAEWPDHDELDVLLRLSEILSGRNPPIADPSEALEELERELEPQALRLLGPGGAILLARRWRELAGVLSEHAFDPAAPRCHASYAYLRAADWEGVRAAVLAEANWSAQPVLLLRLALSERHRGRHDAALTVAFALACRHPEAFAVYVDDGALPDPFLCEHWERFQDEVEALPVRALPAWSLLNSPGLAQRLPQGEASDCVQADADFTLARRLALAATGGGADGTELEARRALNDHSPELLRVWQARVTHARA